MKNILKRSLSFLLAITLIFGSVYAGLGEVDFSGLFAVKASAASSGTCGRNLTWTLDEGILTISGTGAMYDYYFDESPFYENLDIKKVNIVNGVTSIGDCAFYYCESLTSINIPDSVTSIGRSAFRECTSLIYVKLSNNVKTINSCAFMDCTSLASITIPESITQINLDAFGIDLGEIWGSTGDREGIDLWAFCNCTSLKEIIVDEDNAKYSSLDGVLYNKDKTELIRYPVGKNDTTFTIPDTVTDIGDDAFYYCKSLTSIVIPDSVTSIGDDAFYYCKSLTSIVIPDSVTSIGHYAFKDCTNFNSISIPDSVSYIGFAAFSNCTSLDSVYINDLGKWCNIEFVLDYDLIYDFSANPLVYAKKLYLNNKLITNLVIPDGVKKIPEYAFPYMDFETVKMSDDVTIIEDDAFIGCTGLTSITIPKNVTNVSANSFNGCSSIEEFVVSNDNKNYSSCDGVLYNKDKTELIRYPEGKIDTTFTIPYTVTDIGNSAFWACDSLTSITIPNSVTSIGEYAFYRCTSLAEVHYSGSLKQWENITIGGLGNWAPDSATIYFGIVEKPATPTLSSATRVSNGVKVSWGKVSGADKYIVYRKTSKSGWTNLGSTTSTSFTDTKATTGTTYYYTVKAQNEAGYSGYNTKGLGIKYVAAPKLTKITNESSGVRVYWSKVSGADGYYLYRRVAGSKTWTKVATIKKGSTTSYLDKKASAGKTYEYIIKCYDGSTPSASAAKVIKIERLTVPKLVSAKSGKSGITFKWGKVTGASGYIVYRKTGSGSWVKLTTVKGNTKVSYVDKSAKKGKTYTYTVKAYSGSYTSAYNTKGLKIKDKY